MYKGLYILGITGLSISLGNKHKHMHPAMHVKALVKSEPEIVSILVKETKCLKNNRIRKQMSSKWFPYKIYDILALRERTVSKKTCEIAHV